MSDETLDPEECAHFWKPWKECPKPCVCGHSCAQHGGGQRHCDACDCKQFASAGAAHLVRIFGVAPTRVAEVAPGLFSASGAFHIEYGSHDLPGYSGLARELNAFVTAHIAAGGTVSEKPGEPGFGPVMVLESRKPE